MRGERKEEIFQAGIFPFHRAAALRTQVSLCCHLQDPDPLCHCRDQRNVMRPEVHLLVTSGIDHQLLTLWVFHKKKFSLKIRDVVYSG